jgi:hypothetical protein
MKKKEKNLFVLYLMIFGFASCNSIFPTPITKILQNPHEYAGKNIMISGRVEEIFSLYVIKGFAISDETGEIIVISKRPLPQKGSYIKVYGEVEEAFSLVGPQIIVIVESAEK